MEVMSNNYFCQMDGKPASAFWFNGTNKETICDEHVASTFKKGILAFPLEAIDFMQQIDDYSAYNHALATTVKGQASALVTNRRSLKNLNREKVLRGTLSTYEVNFPADMEVCTTSINLDLLQESRILPETVKACRRERHSKN